jgi:hypothetical protein
MTPLDAVQQQLDIICCGRRGIGKHITMLLKERLDQKSLPLVLL